MDPVHKMIPIENDKILITRSLIPPLKTIQYMFTHRPPQAFFVEHLPFICWRENCGYKLKEFEGLDFNLIIKKIQIILNMLIKYEERQFVILKVEI